jgi:hypothetical protein
MMIKTNPKTHHEYKIMAGGFVQENEQWTTGKKHSTEICIPHS